MNQREYWEKAYSTQPSQRLGWYRPHLETSLSWIMGLGLAQDAPILDVGGGVSTLVDDLLGQGYRSIVVLDLSKRALSLAKTRLGGKAELVTWLEGDIASVDLPALHFDLWHDRATFHFLTQPEQQKGYVNNLLGTSKPGGHLIIATFAPEAPPKCNGLPVQRYTAGQLESMLGGEFVLRRSLKELHIAPGGVEQMHLYCHFRRSV